MRIVGQPKSPTGLRRLLFRLPIRLYRMRLGWLLGRRFLLLSHTGRVTGRVRQVVIEVIDHDPGEGTYVVCSGFGTRAEWYRNIRAIPEVTLQVGRHTTAATAVPLSTEEGGEVMARYAVLYPRVAPRLARFMGFAVDGSAADYREVGRRLPFIRFVPRPG